MADVTSQTPGFLSIGASLPTKPLDRLGKMIAKMLEPGPSTAPRRVEVEFQVPPGSDIQIDLQDDVLTVRGAVLTIRGAGRVEMPEPQKYYY